MADGGRIGGEIEPEMAAALGAVANPDNWRGLDEAGKERLQAELARGMSKEDQRKVAAAVAKQQARGGRRG